MSKRGERRKKKKRPRPRPEAEPQSNTMTSVAEPASARPTLLSRLMGPRESPTEPAPLTPNEPRQIELEVELTEDGLPQPRWGLGEAFGGFAVAIVVGGLFAGAILSITGYEPPLPSPGGAVGRVSGQLAIGQTPDVPGTRSLAIDALQQLPFWAALLAVPYLAARYKGNGWVRDFHLRMERSDIGIGLAVGILSQLVLVTGFYWLLFKVIGDQDVSAEARELTDRATTPLGVLLLFLIVGIGAPIAEEVFFRGLALRAFRKRGWAWWPSIVVTAVYFGATHLQPLQFPALIIFGVVVGVLVQRTDRLGPALWAHVGFNLTAAVVLVWNLE